MATQLIVSLDSPKVVEALLDLETMQRWELLRRSEQPYGVARLAEESGASIAATQASLDLLVEAGLATRLMANSKNPRITYRCPARELFVAWDGGKPEHREFLVEVILRLRALSRRLLDEHDAFNTPMPRRRFGTSNFANALISSKDRLKLLKAVHTITDIFAAADARAEERARRGIPDPIAGAVPPPAEGQGDSTDETVWHYHLAMEIRPLLHAVAPIPQFSMWNADYVHELANRHDKNPASILTPKELEVAKRLAVGQTRPFIAKSLGLSTNTVATTSKRIYAKLGVNNRAAIASRMAGG